MYQIPWIFGLYSTQPKRHAGKKREPMAALLINKGKMRIQQQQVLGPERNGCASCRRDSTRSQGFVKGGNPGEKVTKYCQKC